MLNIIIMGPQGSGKGTQAKLLASKYDLEHVEPGKMLRAFAKGKDAKARKINNYLLQGKLVPSDFLFFEIFKPKLAKLDDQRGLIFDGAPRELKQAEYLEEMMDSLNREISYVFYVKISPEETHKRLGKRLTCQDCGRSLILGTDAKSKKDKCPHCGGALYQRKDDTKTGIKKRLEVFSKETIPVIRYFQKKYRVIEIAGEQSIQAVHKEIVKHIKQDFDGYSKEPGGD